MNKANEYINNIKDLLDKVQNTQMQSIYSAAEILSESLSKGGWIFLLGTGHSHILAEEMFYRAGGLVRIKPILEEGLMLHQGASKSTNLERLSGYADILLDDYQIGEKDCIIIISNSGRNNVSIETAMGARKRGIKTIALTSLNHSSNSVSRNTSGKRLFELCDVVLDNCGCYGDASISFGERRVAPTSTVIGAMLLNALECATIELLESKKVEVETFSSSNVTGGDEINNRIIEKYKNQVKGL